VERGQGQRPSVRKDTNEKVSIVIPAFNRKNELRECLESIYRQDYQNFEILIIDNGSTDGTREMILRQYPDVRLFSNRRNLYACRTRNFGVARCVGSYVWFLDSDVVVVKEDCLSTMMELIKSDETIGGIGGTVYIFKDKSTKIALPQHNHFNMFDDWDRENFQLVECDFLPSSNLLMKKDLLLKVGGFTEIYDYLLEDNDLGFKVVKFGLRNVADRRTVAFHPFKSGPVNFRRSYKFYRNVFLFVLLNFHYTKWPRVVADRLRSGHRYSRSNRETGPAIKNQRLAQKLILIFGMFLGLADIIFLSIPVLSIVFGDENYITKYSSVKVPLNRSVSCFLI
jgi:GT2 family glycosyltransferase